MKRKFIKWGLACLLVAAIPSAGLSGKPDLKKPEDVGDGLVLPANVVRVEREGAIMALRLKQSVFYINETRFHWIEETLFVDRKGKPMEMPVLKVGMHVRVEAVDTTDGYLALTVHTPSR